MSTPFRIATDAPGLDIGLLHYRDRAVLRILDRAEAATARQLAILVYGHRRIAQRRLLRLWQAGLLERAIMAHAQRGGAELAYRLSDPTPEDGSSVEAVHATSLAVGTGQIAPRKPEQSRGPTAVKGGADWHWPAEGRASDKCVAGG